MSVSPTLEELLARARADLRMGVPVALDGQEPLIVAPVETTSDARFRALADMSDEPVLAVTARRAETLKARAYDGDIARIVLPSGADASWARSIADPSNDLMTPLKGPLTTLRSGDASTYRFALQLAKSARLLPAVLCIPAPNVRQMALNEMLVCLNVPTTQEVIAQRSPLQEVISARLPLEVSETGRLHVFRPDDGGEEHYAVEIGSPDRQAPVLTRLHSACFTGDLMGSLKCDCGPQLRAAMAQIGQAGAGVLMYMNQEGRGIGLTNKMRAYALQDQGFDTVEANHRLGFEDDERDFRLGADILKALGFSAARLMTNNPHKVEMMRTSGIDVVERVPLHVSENPHNSAYLATKRAKSGHME